MDKFTKTTEVDISNMNIEDETPQKNKAGRILAVIISLLIAVTAWIYVEETDENKYEMVFDDVSVNIINTNEKFNITADNVSVTLVGTNSQLVDVQTSGIIVEVDAASITTVGDYFVTSKEVYVDDDICVEVKNVTVSVKVHVSEK